MERNSMIYENVPDRRAEELLGILKTLDGSAIFCDSVLCRRASRVVCAANQIKMAAPERSIRHGKALRIPIIARDENFSLLREEFSFVNTNCLFYIIDSRPQKPGMDVKLLPNRHSSDRLSRRFVPESARDDSVPTEGESCPCAEFVRLVGRNSKYATILVVVLGCALLTVTVAFVIVIVHWSSGGQNVRDDDGPLGGVIKVNDTRVGDAIERNSTKTTMTKVEKEGPDIQPTAPSLRQLYEKQQNELILPKLACGLTYASKLVAEIFEQNDDLINWMDLTQQVALAKCPSEAFCPALHECAPNRFVRKTVAVRIIANDSDVDEQLFASWEVEEAASCSCQPISFVEYVTEDDVTDDAFELENRTRRDVSLQDHSATSNLIFSHLCLVLLLVLVALY